MSAYPELIPLSSKKPYIQFTVSLIIILLFALAGLLLALLTGWLIFGIAPGEVSIGEQAYSLKEINYFKYIQVLQHLSIFLVPSLIISFFMKRDIGSYLGANRSPGAVASLLSIIFIFFLIPLTSYLGWLNAGLDLPRWLEGLEQWMQNKEEQAGQLTGLLINTTSIGGLMVNMLIIAIIPAVGEEFLYRGVLQKIFTGWFRSGHMAVLLAAFLFSATHLQFYGFLPRFILGLAFGYMYLWSGSIWLPVLAHFVNNAIPVFLAYLLGWENINSAVDEFSAQDGLIVIVPTIIAVLILLNIRRVSTGSS
ncbi:MAG: type II CAAX endopeptidase family protein [Bacteroidales bacterium]|nr:type II CAAX endopeptidase family protein [Bacteroidales bacterium]